MPSSPSKVFDQLVDAQVAIESSTDRQHSMSSMELAPPSSSLSASLSPKKSTSNNSAEVQPRSLPLSPNKLFSHVERAEAIPPRAIMKNHPQQQQLLLQAQPPTPPPSSSTAMQDTVERIVNAVENREASSRESALVNGTVAQQQQQILEVTHGGPFTSTELSQLALLCTFGFSSSSSKNGGANQSQWATVDGDLLASLTPLLRAHVTTAMRVDLVGEGLDVIVKTVKTESSPEKKSRPVITIHQWMMQVAKYSGPNAAPLGSLGDSKLEPGAGFNRLQVLLCGLEASNILLSIMASPGVDRRVVEDDTLEACVTLMKNHIQKHLIPALSNTGHVGVSMSTISDNGSCGGEAERTPKSKKSRSVSPNRGVVAKSLKAVYSPILSTVGQFGTMIERADVFVARNEMDDSLLFTLSGAALSTLTIDASPLVRADAVSLASIIQVSSMDLIAAIFRRYPRHRSIIIEDVFPLMLKLPTSKKSLRTFLVKKSAASSSTSEVAKGPPTSNVADHDYIQPICALTLLLIQSCVVMPSQDDDEQMEGAEDSNDSWALKDDHSGLQGCVAVCNQFTSQMLQRCARKGEEGGASEFRPILSNLIDDLLLVRHLPEYPAAGMLLLYLSHRLGSDLLRASSAAKNQVEATYLATAMDAFGKITSAVAGSLQRDRENPFKLPDSMNLCAPSPEPTEEINRCFCGRGNLDTFMIDCDRCHSWHHGSCVGISKDTVPDIWLCDDCTLQTTVVEQAKVFARGSRDSDSLTSTDHNHVLRQLLLSYLSWTAQASHSQIAERAREFLIASWVKQLEGSDETVGCFDLGLVRNFAISQWTLPTLQPNQQRPRAHLTDDGNQRIMTSLVASSELCVSFNRLLGVILRLMGDKLASLRKLSVKAILQVVNIDPALMAQPTVRKEVSRCFHDESISVREAAVSLVGDYIMQSPNLAAAFHAPLLERIVDKGISVRKRAVRIFRDVLLSNPTYEGRVTACHAMMQRAADRKEDDGVRDLIHETFHTLWFNSKAFDMGSTGSPAKSKPAQLGTKAELYCREVSAQMVEVVRVSGSNEVLSTLVKGLLFGFAEGDKDKKNVERKKRQEDSHSQCKLLVKALIELLLSFEDTRDHKEDDGKQLVAILATLGVFAQSFPELVVPHVDTLVPYLKGDNGVKRYEGAVVSQVSSMISGASSHFSSGELNRLTSGELPTDLVNICYKFPSEAVTSAVEALAKLANHPDAASNSVQEKKLLKLATQFYSYLLKTKDVTNDFSSMKKSVRDNVRRALAALGSICRFYECTGAADDHTLDSSVFVIETDVAKLQLSNLSNAAFALFLRYLSKEDESTKCLALRAMNGVFISRPRVVLVAEQMGIITSVIGDEAPPSVQIESLRCWRDILISEEKRIDSGAAKAKMEAQKDVTLSKRIGGDQDGDSSISGSVLTEHSERLYALTLSKDEKVRHMIIDLIGHLLRQGLINPMETVPHLLAVQGDVKCPSTRALALKLLQNEGEKRPDMLRQRICAGIKQAFHFQRNVYSGSNNGNAKVTALIAKSDGPKDGWETIFDAVIKESAIRNKKAQRQGLLKGIISLFEKDPGVNCSSAEQLPMLAFASEILGNFPYTSLSDPLFIVYHSSCIAALDGQGVLSQFAELVGGDVCDPNSDEDDIEKSSTQGKFDAAELGLEAKGAEFGQLCVEAARILPLLKLKQFLRKAYNISEARITSYVPSEKELIHEKGISIADGPPFSFTMTSIFDADGNINWSNATKIYSSFRRMMRDAEADDVHVDPEPTKSPKRTAKRKRGGSDQVEESPKVSPE